MPRRWSSDKYTEARRAMCYADNLEDHVESSRLGLALRVLRRRARVEYGPGELERCRVLRIFGWT